MPRELVARPIGLALKALRARVQAADQGFDDDGQIVLQGGLEHQVEGLAEDCRAQLVERLARGMGPGILKRRGACVEQRKVGQDDRGRRKVGHDGGP